MRFILGIIFTLVIIALAGLTFIYSGWMNVSATNQDTGLKAWILSTTMDHSVKHHAKGITAPASLSDPAVQMKGFKSFDQMCAGCHGAPGRERGGRGFNPEAPSLVTVLDDWKPEELFWIVKNGIKMSAMPTFGARQSDDDLWAIVAFLRTLPDYSPEQYLAKRDSLRAVQMADTTHHQDKRPDDRVQDKKPSDRLRNPVER